MSALADMRATYVGPGRVVARLLGQGPREDRLLAIVMFACGMVFVAQWPRLAREAHLAGQDLNPMLGGSLLAWVIIMPLVLYALAAISHGLARILGGSGTGYGARLALFWALFASVPLLLLHGLVAGFIGAGPGLTLVGALWLGVFAWFWGAGLVVTQGKGRK